MVPAGRENNFLTEQKKLLKRQKQAAVAFRAAQNAPGSRNSVSRGRLVSYPRRAAAAHRPNSTVTSRIFSARIGDASPGSIRHCQLPLGWPGVFIRAQPPRPR